MKRTAWGVLLVIMVVWVSLAQAGQLIDLRQSGGGFTPLGGNGSSANVYCTGGCSGGTQYAEDSVHVSGDSGTLALGVRKDTAASLAGADGDYTAPIFDASGRLWINCGTGCSGGTQYAEDTLHVTGDTLSLAGVVQQSADAALAGDGDRTLLQVDANGYLKVNIKAGAGSGGTAMTDDAAFTPGSTSITPAGAMFDDVTPDSVNEGDGGVLRMSANRNLYTTLRDAAGNERGANINASNELLTNANTELPAAVQSTTTGQTAPTAPFVNAFIHCQDPSAVTISPCIASANVAHDAVGTGANPLLIGGYASAAAPTDVSADGDAVRAWSLRNGARAVQSTFAGVLATTGAGNTGTGVQRVIEATDSQLSAGVGATGDAAATAGSAGSLTAKLRLMTSQLDAIQTAVQLVDDDQTGASMHHRVSVGTTEDEHEIKATAGRLFSVSASNTNASTRYLRCANNTAAGTTPGTTSVWFGLAIPGATTGAGFTHSFGPAGVAFSTGLTCWLVTGAAENDVAEVAANEINVNYSFK